jgi:hypothetical protein
MKDASPPRAAAAPKLVRVWQSYNQRRWEFEKDVLDPGERAPFVCECMGDGCLAAVELTMQEFEAAHMCPNWCAVRPEHVLGDDGTRVVIQQPHYWVVELAPLPDQPH